MPVRCHPVAKLHDSSPAPSLFPRNGGTSQGAFPQHVGRRAAASCAISAAMTHNLRQLRLRKGWRLEDAAKAFGLSAKGYEKLEYSSRKLSLNRINKAAEVYGVSVAEVVSAQHEIPVVGTVSHGGTVLYGSIGDKDLIAPRPNDATSVTVALLVDKGVTVPGIAIENYFLYHDEKCAGVPDEHIGKLCFVKIRGGDALIRRIFLGSVVGRYDLVGIGFETMRDQEVEWSALLTWLKPR